MPSPWKRDSASPCRVKRRCTYEKNAQVGSCSRDPIGYAGDAMSFYEYVDSGPSTAVDPTGLTGAPGQPTPGQKPSGAVPNGFCRVSLECTHLGAPVLGPTHCGIKMEWGKLEQHIHVNGAWPGAAPITFTGSQAHFPPILGSWYPYWTQAEWLVPKATCDCINRTKKKIVAQEISYHPTPGNPCEGPRQGNSNYSTKCLLTNCNISLHGLFGLTTYQPGWNHRIKKCVRHASGSGCSRGCRCLEWQTVDESWCSEGRGLYKPKPTNGASQGPRGGGR
jgi:hypothetical protein